MDETLAKKIAASPKYGQLTQTRSSYGWILTALMMVVYYGYIMLIAFNKEFLGQKLGTGVMTMGIPIGFGVIVFTVIITGIYVRRANNEFDKLSEEIVREASK